MALLCSLFAFASADITGADITSQPLVCSGDNHTQCLLDSYGLDAEAAKANEAAEQAKEKEEKDAANRIAKELLSFLEWKLKDKSGFFFVSIVVACIICVVCVLVGSHLKIILFGSGPITVSTAKAEQGEHPPSDALLIDDEGKVLAARRAEMSVPLDHAAGLTVQQWAGIRSVRFTYLQEGEKCSFSGEVVERAKGEDGRLVLRLASGGSLCIEDEGATLFDAAETKQCSVEEGAITIAQSHVNDLAELKQRVQRSNQVDL